MATKRRVSATIRLVLLSISLLSACHRSGGHQSDGSFLALAAGEPGAPLRDVESEQEVKMSVERGRRSELIVRITPDRAGELWIERTACRLRDPNQITILDELQLARGKLRSDSDGSPLVHLGAAAAGAPALVTVSFAAPSEAQVGSYECALLIAVQKDNPDRIAGPAINLRIDVR